LSDRKGSSEVPRDLIAEKLDVELDEFDVLGDAPQRIDVWDAAAINQGCQLLETLFQARFHRDHFLHSWRHGKSGAAAFTESSYSSRFTPVRWFSDPAW